MKKLALIALFAFPTVGFSQLLDYWPIPYTKYDFSAYEGVSECRVYLVNEAKNDTTGGLLQIISFQDGLPVEVAENTPIAMIPNWRWFMWDEQGILTSESRTSKDMMDDELKEGTYYEYDEFGFVETGTYSNNVEDVPMRRIEYTHGESMMIERIVESAYDSETETKGDVRSVKELHYNEHVVMTSLDCTDKTELFGDYTQYFEYDDKGNVVKIVLDFKDESSPDYEYYYGYDSNGRMISKRIIAPWTQGNGDVYKIYYR